MEASLHSLLQTKQKKETNQIKLENATNKNKHKKTVKKKDPVEF